MTAHFRTVVVGLAAVVAATTSACGPAETPVPSDPRVLATYRGGEITTGDLDAAILALPAGQRRVPQDRAFDRNRRLVEVLAVNRLLLDRAESEGVQDEPEVVVALEEARQRIVAESFLQRELAKTEPVTEDDAREYYAEHGESFHQPARRLTLNIFRRVGGETDVEAATREMEELRQRVVDGESFGSLARRYSDSESAERDGEIGWIDETTAPPDLAAVVFALEPGVPSRPVVTAEGVHLFMVTSAAAARSYSFDEVESRIVEILVNRKRQQLMEETAAGLPDPDPYFVADADEVGYLLEGGDPHAEIFRIGGSTMTLARFRFLLERNAAAQTGQPTPRLAGALLAALVDRARIYEYSRSEGLLDEPDLRAKLERATEDTLVNFMRDRMLREEAERDGDALETYFEANLRRFSTPLTVDADVLVVPIPASGAIEVMDRLSRLDDEPAADRLENEAAAVGGRIERLERATLDQIHRFNPKVARIVSTMEEGRCSQPVRIGDAVAVIELRRRVEPEPRPFAEVADTVAEAYVRDHRRELYERWSERLLRDAGFTLFDDRVRTWLPDGTAGRIADEPTGDLD